jgi:transaldolase
MVQALDDLAAARVSVWLDGVSRPRIVTGSLACMVDGGEIVAIATNPTIFTKATAQDRAMRRSCVIWHSAEPPYTKLRRAAPRRTHR